MLGRSVAVPGNTVPVDGSQVTFRTARIVLISGHGASANTILSTFLPSWMSRVRAPSPASSPLKGGFEYQSSARLKPLRAAVRALSTRSGNRCFNGGGISEAFGRHQRPVAFRQVNPGIHRPPLSVAS